jgi:hypothetical protein
LGFSFLFFIPSFVALWRGEGRMFRQLPENFVKLLKKTFSLVHQPRELFAMFQRRVAKTNKNVWSTQQKN